MRCPRCGNENPGTNRFCGMCGATLLPAPAPVGTTQSAAPAPAPTSPSPLPSFEPAPTAPQNAPPPRAPERVRDESPTISGPSFLGLNDPPPPSRSRRSSLSIDPNSASNSRDLDYLLEDDEPKRGGAIKFLLIIVALLLAVGFGYLRFKDQGFAWLTSNPKKPDASAPADSSSSNASQPAGVPEDSPAKPPAAVSTQVSQPAPEASAPANAPAASPPTAPSPSITTVSEGAKPAATTSAADSAKAAPPEKTSAKAPPKNPVETDEDDPNTADFGAAAAKPKPAPAEVAPAPRNLPPARPAVARPAGSIDPVSEAQKYLYGKGALQDCDRGLRILKPAADRANTKAMIEMGALYSAGLCTPRDLPTSYRWFALALRKEPDNQSVQSDLQKLWGEMTQPERQLAIRLSQ